MCVVPDARDKVPGHLVDDAGLLARTSAGDREAFELLYRRHGPWLTARLQSRCADPDIADLALQDTFVAVWRSAGRYRAEGDVGAWIWGIAVRRLIDQLRKRRTTPLDPTRIADELDAHEATTGYASIGATVDGSMSGVLESDELQRAVRALTPELRAVLIATAIDGLTTKEAGRLLGVPQGTVKTRLMRARHQLQEALT
jgi:RNA polymerase sigma-70 factor, ECF subfamily